MPVSSCGTTTGNSLRMSISRTSRGEDPQIELANPEKSLTGTIEPQADLLGRRRRQSHDNSRIAGWAFL
jgi:hypothetical protein